MAQSQFYICKALNNDSIKDWTNLYETSGSFTDHNIITFCTKHDYTSYTIGKENEIKIKQKSKLKNYFDLKITTTKKGEKKLKKLQ